MINETGFTLKVSKFETTPFWDYCCGSNIVDFR